MPNTPKPSRRLFCLSGLPLLVGCQKQCRSQEAGQRPAPSKKSSSPAGLGAGPIQQGTRSEVPRLHFGTTGDKQLHLDIRVRNLQRVDQVDRLIVDVAWENTSKQTFRLYERWNSWGADQLVFLLCHEDGRRYLFANSVKLWEKNAPTTLVLHPGERHEERIYLKFREGDGPPLSETDHWVAVASGIKPEPAVLDPDPVSSSGRYPWHVRALFMSSKPDEQELPPGGGSSPVPLWTGQVPDVSIILEEELPEPQVVKEPLDGPVVWAFPAQIQRARARDLPPHHGSAGLLPNQENGLKLDLDVVRASDAYVDVRIDFSNNADSTLVPSFGIEDPVSSRSYSILGFEVRSDNRVWQLGRLSAVKAGAGIQPPLLMSRGQQFSRNARLWLRGKPDRTSSPMTYVHYPYTEVPKSGGAEVRAVYQLPVSFVDHGWAGQLATEWVQLP